MNRPRLVWLVALGAIPLVSAVLAECAAAVMLLHGASAPFWVPPMRGFDGSADAWLAALIYAVFASGGLILAWGLSPKAKPAPSDPPE